MSSSITIRSSRMLATSSAIETRRHWLVALTLVLVCGAGCGGDGESAAPESCAAGDPAAPLEFDTMYRTLDGELARAVENSELPLLTPPQGGLIFLVGPRATNLTGCHVELATALLDTESRSVITIDRRPVALEPNADGSLTPKNPRGLSGYANVAACPAAALTRPVNGVPYQLQMTVTDLAGRSAQRVLNVVPTCGDGPGLADCECLCSVDYRQGEPCGAAGGPSP
jgi:hypothetical protein